LTGETGFAAKVRGDGTPWVSLALTLERMVLKHRDFRPLPLEYNFLGAVSKYETVSELTARVNAWLAAEAIRPLNVETLLIPCINSELQTEVWVDNGIHLQTVRVWYLED